MIAYQSVRSAGDLPQTGAWRRLGVVKAGQSLRSGTTRVCEKHKNCGNEAKKSLKTKEVTFSWSAKRTENEPLLRTR
jgi:hypothetical protein